MITLVNSEVADIFLGLAAAGSATACKLYTNFMVYGMRQPFCQNYLLEGVAGMAALQIYHSTLLMQAEAPRPVWEEAAEFARFFGCTGIELCLPVGVAPPVDWGTAWVYPLFAAAPHPLKEGAVPQIPQSLRPAYTLLSTAFEDWGRAVPYEEFLAETMPKVNAGYAGVYTLGAGNTPLAVGVLHATNTQYSLLGGLATAAYARRKGFATRLVGRVQRVAGGKTLLAVSQTPQADLFYQSLGFRIVGKQAKVVL